MTSSHFSAYATKVFTRPELEAIANLCKRYDVICVSDEVYEWMVFSGNKHIRIGERRPGVVLSQSGKNQESS